MSYFDEICPGNWQTLCKHRSEIEPGFLKVESNYDARCEREMRLMKNDFNLRKWATPVTIGAFALSAVTGILLFFNVRAGMVKPVHEWLSWLLVVGVIFHAIVNRQCFVKYLSKPLGRGIMIFFALLIGASLLPLGEGQGKSHSNPMARASDSLIRSPLTEVSQIADHEADEAVGLLKSKGISVERKDQTIQEIAAKNKMNPVRVLDAIF